MSHVVFIGAGSGLVRKRQGGSWSNIDLPVAQEISVLAGSSPTNVWAGGAYVNKVWQGDGVGNWIEHTTNHGRIFDLHVVSETEVYALSENASGIAIEKWDGSVWSTLYSQATGWGGARGLEVFGSNFYVWGTPGLYRWNGVSFVKDTAAPGPAVYTFAAVSETEMYVAGGAAAGYSYTQQIYKGQFGGPWTVDLDFTSGETDGIGIGASNTPLLLDRNSGYIWTVSCRLWGAQPFVERWKSGGVWYDQEIPPFTSIQRPGDKCQAGLGGAGVVKAIPCYGPVAGEETLVYESSAWSEYNLATGTDNTRAAYVAYDGAAPYLSNQSPRPDSNGNPADTPIGVEVLDDDWGVDGSTVQIWVDGTLAWDGASIQSGFSGTRTAVAKGYRYDFRPDTAFAFNDVISVRVAADDNAGNSLDETYYFGVEIEEEYVGYGDQYGEGQFGEEYGPRPWEPNWVEKFYTDFTDPPSVLKDLGNGSITEATGVLTLSTPNGVNCDWWASVANAPLAYAKLTDKLPYRPEVVRLQTRVTSYTNHSGGLGGLNIMLCLVKDRQNMYGFGWAYDYSIGAVIRGMRLVANVATAIGLTGSGISDPNTAPHIYRIYWNQATRQRYVPEISAFMEANEIRLYYSIDDGDTFTPGVAPYISTVAFTPPYRIGVAVKTWNNLPAVDIEFSGASLEAHQWDPETEEWLPYTDQPTDPQEKVGLEDVLTLPSASGAPRWDVPEVDHDVPLTKQQVGLEDVRSGPIAASGKPIWSSPDALPGDKPLYRLEAGLEDVIEYFLVDQPEISTYTTDANAIAHFLYTKPYLLHYYDTTGEAWANPTAGGFTGYARNGKHYTGGVEDPGPVWAPWATEAQSANRGPRDDFPLKALLAMTKQELVIFDLDSFDGTPASLHVWMRFTLPDTSYFRALGRGSETIACIRMKNGVLYAGGKPTGWENGRLHSIDFKANDQTVYSLIGGDGHWWGVSGKTIVNRNDTASVWTTTGVSPSLRIVPEYVYDLAIYDDGTSVWVAAGGEDTPTQVIRYTGNKGQEVVNAIGADVGGDNAGNVRHAVFDEDGWLWFAVGSTVFRNVHDYQERYIIAEKGHERVGYADLSSTILDLVQVKNSIYARTTEGIWRIPRGSMAAYLAYTVVGGGGGGKDNTPPAGELLGGTARLMQSLQGFTLESGSFTFGYLVVASWLASEGYGAATILRLLDDVVVATYEYPTLTEPGALYAVTTLFA